MSEQKKHIVRSLIYEVWGGGNLSRLEDLVDPKVVANFGTERKPIVGLSSYRELIAAYQALIGAIEFTIEEQLVADDGFPLGADVRDDARIDELLEPRQVSAAPDLEYEARHDLLFLVRHDRALRLYVTERLQLGQDSGWIRQ